MNDPGSVVVNEVSFAYPDGHQALRKLSITIRQGERVAILGPNGAGKTTFALHLNGVVDLSEGTIEIGGLQLAPANLAEIRRRVGMVFQNPDDQLFMPTVADDVAFGPANLGLTPAEQTERVNQALAAVGATELARRTPHHLSGGEKRRVAIATVLAMQPEILVLDEPASGLDPAAKRELIGLLGSLDLTQLVITHDLPLALELCPRAVIVNEGAVVADGATADLLSDSALLERNRLELPYGFNPAHTDR